MTRILITGVRGKTAVPLAASLASRPGVAVLGGSSAPSQVAADGVRPTAFSWDEPAGWPAAVDGIDAVYVVRPDRADAPEVVGALLETTPAGAHVVLLSERNVDRFPDGDWARRVEEAVHGSGRSWTVLRPGWFMQVLEDPRFYRDSVLAGELSFSSGGAGLAWIDARDIAAVAELALLEPGNDGAVHELTGPETISLPRTAEVLTEGLGRPVAHRELTIEEAVAGAEGFDREVFTATLERVHAGLFSEVTDAVERLTGRPARTLRGFAAELGRGPA